MNQCSQSSPTLPDVLKSIWNGTFENTYFCKHTMTVNSRSEGFNWSNTQCQAENKLLHLRELWIYFLKFAGLGLLLKKPHTLCAFSSVRLKDVALIALKIYSFLLPLIPFSLFPPLLSVMVKQQHWHQFLAPSSWWDQDLDPTWKAGECCYISWALFSLLAAAVLS